MFALTMALGFAWLFGVGRAQEPIASTAAMTTPPSLQSSLLRVIFSNPIHAFTGANMLQLILIAILVGVAIRHWRVKAEKLERFIVRTNGVLMMAILWFMLIAPYGIFCLVTVIFAKSGLDLLGSLAGYFATVLFVLAVQWVVIYGSMLSLLARLNPLQFFRKMRSAMLFAFSVSSSNASIPIVLEACQEQLGIDNSVASFVIPLGATVNMDGTAIMQGVATVFVANLYGLHLGLQSYLLVIISATLASIGAAGVPSVGLITLAMVFQQVGLPVEGIAMILGVDRLLDMTRTAVNISGDSTVACVVAKSEDAIDLTVFNSKLSV